MKTICIFGDSIAVGKNAPKEEGWGHHLKKFLEERDTEISVVNLAAGGANSENVLKIIKEDCEKHKPSEVIIAVGINDSLYSFKDHRSIILHEQFEKNMNEIFSTVQKHAKKIMVIGITRVDERGSTISDGENNVYQYQNKVIQKYNDSLKAISESQGAIFISTYEILSDDDLDDGYHPNASGHGKLFEAIKRIV